MIDNIIFIPSPLRSASAAASVRRSLSASVRRDRLVAVLSHAVPMVAMALSGLLSGRSVIYTWRWYRGSRGATARAGHNRTHVDAALVCDGAFSRCCSWPWCHAHPIALVVSALAFYVPKPHFFQRCLCGQMDQARTSAAASDTLKCRWIAAGSEPPGFCEKLYHPAGAFHGLTTSTASPSQ